MPPPHLSTSAPAPLHPSCPHRPDGGTRGRHPRPPHPSPFVRKGGARGHAAPFPRYPDTSPSRPAPPSPIRAERVHAGTPPPAPPLLPWVAPPHARDGGTRGHDAPGCPVRAGTPHLGPPFPIRAEGGAPKQGHASARRPRPRLPSCPRHPVHAERGHPCRAAGPARSPCARVHRARTPFARHSTT
ncbi:hypothetical protein EDB85DRAFT_2025360 [Lactarius pseudohatsudake]|nr:hypothetical protein EDB85DRAFT_2025360 [Lactarius pseudohatsudake]